MYFESCLENVLLTFRSVFMMCQVTKNNFEMLYPDICQHIDKCSFVSFDCEFTALQPDSDQNNSLFDDAGARYSKLSNPPVHSIISQFGLSIFEQDLERKDMETGLIGIAILLNC